MQVYETDNLTPSRTWELVNSPRSTPAVGSSWCSHSGCQWARPVRGCRTCHTGWSVQRSRWPVTNNNFNAVTTTGNISENLSASLTRNLRNSQLQKKASSQSGHTVGEFFLKISQFLWACKLLWILQFNYMCYNSICVCVCDKWKIMTSIQYLSPALSWAPHRVQEA